jgi:hypothetical protein
MMGPTSNVAMNEFMSVVTSQHEYICDTMLAANNALSERLAKLEKSIECILNVVIGVEKPKNDKVMDTASKSSNNLLENLKAVESGENWITPKKVYTVANNKNPNWVNLKNGSSILLPNRFSPLNYDSKNAFNSECFIISAFPSHFNVLWAVIWQIEL